MLQQKGAQVVIVARVCRGAALNGAIDLGLNFIDTAEGYGKGHGERVIAHVLRGRSERVYVATKTPPKPGPWPPTAYCTVEERYPEQYLRANVDARLKNLDTDAPQSKRQSSRAQ
jgi:aryl-alcohol dehydrogenase-like predicted oxidoreductase